MASAQRYMGETFGKSEYLRCDTTQCTAKSEYLRCDNAQCTAKYAPCGDCGERDANFRADRPPDSEVERKCDPIFYRRYACIQGSVFAFGRNCRPKGAQQFTLVIRYS